MRLTETAAACQHGTMVGASVRAFVLSAAFFAFDLPGQSRASSFIPGKSGQEQGASTNKSRTNKIQLPLARETTSSRSRGTVGEEVVPRGAHEEEGPRAGCVEQQRETPSQRHSHLGAMLHAQGQCEPCLNFFTTGTCPDADGCWYCHVCGPAPGNLTRIAGSRRRTLLQARGAARLEAQTGTKRSSGHAWLSEPAKQQHQEPPSSRAGPALCRGRWGGPGCRYNHGGPRDEQLAPPMPADYSSALPQSIVEMPDRLVVLPNTDDVGGHEGKDQPPTKIFLSDELAEFVGEREAVASPPSTSSAPDDAAADAESPRRAPVPAASKFYGPTTSIAFSGMQYEPVERPPDVTMGEEPPQVMRLQHVPILRMADGGLRNVGPMPATYHDASAREVPVDAGGSTRSVDGYGAGPGAGYNYEDFDVEGFHGPPLPPINYVPEELGQDGQLGWTTTFPPVPFAKDEWSCDLLQDLHDLGGGGAAGWVHPEYAQLQEGAEETTFLWCDEPEGSGTRSSSWICAGDTQSSNAERICRPPGYFGGTAAKPKPGVAHDSMSSAPADAAPFFNTSSQQSPTHSPPHRSPANLPAGEAVAFASRGVSTKSKKRLNAFAMPFFPAKPARPSGTEAEQMVLGTEPIARERTNECPSPTAAMVCEMVANVLPGDGDAGEAEDTETAAGETAPSADGSPEDYFTRLGKGMRGQLEDFLKEPVGTLSRDALHEIRACKPCAFYQKDGCANGENCPWCHLCPLGEKKVRKKEKIQLRKWIQQQGEGGAAARRKRPGTMLIGRRNL